VANGKPRTAAQQSALAAGREKRKAAAVDRRVRRADGEVSRPMERLRQLIDGELTVRDLDDEEIRRGRCHDGHGSFVGRPPAMPARIQDLMYQENIRRTNRVFAQHASKAAKRMVAIMTEEGADPTQLRAAMAIVERHIGKVPDVVHVGPESEFDRLQQGVFEFDRSELQPDEE
jgi:hypothetical protein